MPTNENYLGSDLTGTDGDTDRVLTLANSKLTLSGGFQVFVNGSFIYLTDDYTINHQTSGTEITFIGQIFDIDKISVTYYVSDEIPSGTFKYTNEDNVYTKSGLTSSEVNFASGDNANIIHDAESEVEYLTGRKWTNLNTKTDYLSGAKKDILGISGTKSRTIILSEYPIQEISEFKILNVDGTTAKTYATLSAANISSGVYDTVDYWADSMEDPLTNNTIAYGKITLKTDEIPTGNRNIKVSYKYGYSTTPIAIRDLASCLAGIRAWIRFMGGSFNRLDSYSVPQQTVSKGDFYSRAMSNINTLKEEANRILDRIGRRPRVLFLSSGGDR